MKTRNGTRALGGLLLTGALVAALPRWRHRCRRLRGPDDDGPGSRWPRVDGRRVHGSRVDGPERASAMMGEPFGPACASVPADGAGSFEGMAKDPVATAASNNPALSTLVDRGRRGRAWRHAEQRRGHHGLRPGQRRPSRPWTKATLDAALADPAVS